jgi:hypothetical protein
MVEIRVWKWEYTDDSGRRRVSRWLMTEHEALRYKDPLRLQHTLQVWYDRLSGEPRAEVAHMRMQLLP